MFSSAKTIERSISFHKTGSFSTIFSTASVLATDNSVPASFSTSFFVIQKFIDSIISKLIDISIVPQILNTHYLSKFEVVGEFCLLCVYFQDVIYLTHS